MTVNPSTSSNKRPDGRLGGGSLRPLACELSCLQQCNGSAKWSAGGSKVIAAVHGPIAPRRTESENPENGLLVVIYPGSRKEEALFLERALSACIVLEMYPQTMIEVVLQTIQSDGSMLGTALHAAVAALLDAGIHMRTIPVSTTCLLKTNQANSFMIHLDPISDEETTDSVVVVVTPSQGSTDGIGDGVIGTFATGPPIPLDALFSCYTKARKARGAVASFLKLAVEQKVTNESNTVYSF